MPVRSFISTSPSFRSRSTRISAHSLGSANGQSPCGLLLGEAGHLGIGLCNASALLECVELNVAVAGEVGRDATVSAVCAPAARDGSLHNSMADGASLDIEALGLGISPQVDEEFTDSLDRFLGPATERVLESLDLSMAADTTSVYTEGNYLLVFSAVFQVVNCLVELESFACSCNFVGVLVMNTEVSDLALGG